MDEIIEINKKRDEIRKRIQERQRQMELIKNKNTKNIPYTAELFKRDQAIKKIQRAYRSYKGRIEKNEVLQRERELAKYKFQESKEGHDLNFMIKLIKIQKQFRHYLMVKNHERLRDRYIGQRIDDFYQPIDYQRGAELRKQLFNKLRASKQISDKEFKNIFNKYYNSYKDFCFTFDDNEKLREDNWVLYHQNYDMLHFMESINPNLLSDGDERFKKFMLDKNKMPIIKKQVDQMEYSYMHNNMFDGRFDDLEERYILDEVDNMYNYESWENLLKGNK